MLLFCMVVKTGLLLKREEHRLRRVIIRDEENNELSNKKQQAGVSYIVNSFNICTVHPVFVTKSNKMGQSELVAQNSDRDYTPNSSSKTGTVQTTRQPCFGRRTILKLIFNEASNDSATKVQLALTTV